MQVAPWLAMWPGIFLTVVVYGFNMFGDAVPRPASTPASAAAPARFSAPAASTLDRLAGHDQAAYRKTSNSALLSARAKSASIRAMTASSIRYSRQHAHCRTG